MVSNNDVIEYQPLYMSMIAGMSTCLGAAWVLFQRSDTTKKVSSRRPGSAAPPVIPPSTMCFSLALAGSVMVTVSVISIIPECLREEEIEGVTSTGYRMIPLWSRKFLYLMISHAIGYILYFLLAKFVFPEPPEEILGEALLIAVKTTTTTTAALASNDSQDIEELRSLSTGGKSMSLDEPQPHIPKAGKAPTPNQNARNRRGVLGGDAPAELNTNNTKESSNGDSDNDDDVKEGKADFFQSFSRYSSGADLETHESRRAWRVAMLLFLSLTVHNFPEGLAVAASAMESRELGLKVTIGIMVHNIPEGVSIAVPCLAARPDNPWLAFWLAALSGLAEPLGAFVALFALRNIDKNNKEESVILNMENVLAFVAGIMIMVAVAELFPEALRHTAKDGNFYFVTGTISGIVLMGATELYLA